FLAVCCIILTSVLTFAQEHRRHTVVKGQTITQIAQQYRITPYDIYRLNPESRNGIKENDVLIISSSTQITSPMQGSSHEVQPKETLFSIARRYNVSVEDIRVANPVLSQGLKAG